jgi:hypothetical protein
MRWKVTTDKLLKQFNRLSRQPVAAYVRALVGHSERNAVPEKLCPSVKYDVEICSNERLVISTHSEGRGFRPQPGDLLPCPRLLYSVGPAQCQGSSLN